MEKMEIVGGKRTPLNDRLLRGEEIPYEELVRYVAELERRVAVGEYGPGDRIA